MVKRKTEPGTRVVGYVRVSLEKQADNGHSLDTQEAKLRAYCELHELELVDLIRDEGRSGKSLDRPGLQRALGMLSEGQADALLVFKLDRLTRSVADLGRVLADYFTDGRWSLLSFSDALDTRTAAGRLIIHILGSVAQWQREDSGERTSATMRGMRDRGLYTGGRARFGFKPGPDGQLAEDPREQAAIVRARQLKARGRSVRAIAAKLRAEGHRSRTGAPITPSVVHRILAAKS